MDPGRVLSLSSQYICECSAELMFFGLCLIRAVFLEAISIVFDLLSAQWKRIG